LASMTIFLWLTPCGYRILEVRWTDNENQDGSGLFFSD
jgi:hypothetical protein